MGHTVLMTTRMLGSREIHFETCPECNGVGRKMYANGCKVETCGNCFGGGESPVERDRIPYGFGQDDRTPARPISKGGATQSRPPTTNRYAGKCTECGQWVEANAGLLAKIDGKFGAKHTECPPVRVAGVTSVRPTHNTPATLSLDSLPAGRYAVPGGATRLKVEVDKPDEGDWAGWTFVRDAAEYGQGQKYGNQKPGAPQYRGQIIEELRAIIADPRAASAAYGHLVGRCGVCGRALEDKVSVERGIGPICASKMGW